MRTEHKAFLEEIRRWRSVLAAILPGGDASAQRTVDQLLFLRLCELRNLKPNREPISFIETGTAAVARGAPPGRSGPELATDVPFGGVLDTVRRALYIPEVTARLEQCGVELLGQVYEQYLADRDQSGKKANGIYYTPRTIADRLVEATVGRTTEAASLAELARLRILDPACGCGFFLLSAYRHLLDRYRLALLREPQEQRQDRLVQAPSGDWVLTTAERQRILRAHIFGVDRDADALETARRGLVLASIAEFEDAPTFVELNQNLIHGDALLASDFPTTTTVDWATALPTNNGTGFDVVIGNPPWGQKAIGANDATKTYLGTRFPSSRGIFDWFRPFVELGVRLLRPGGRFGMVLPDIVLLKDYEPTRSFLLERLALERIEWLGMAFSGATIDAVTISGRTGPASAEHLIDIIVHDAARPLAHRLRQQDFHDNPRRTFNLHLTDAKRSTLRRLAGLPRLGQLFAPHEGIHSGNIRAELFVPYAIDDSCRPLLFGRDELIPFLLRWAGRYVRLAALPARRSRERYANLGRPEWHECPKVVVRRTGDRVTAAVDEAGRYASNNFFLLLPTRPAPLSLDGLCALLNSRFMTWFFRTVEPRTGRAFAELKIKHLLEFPIPPLGADCQKLNEYGIQRRLLATQPKSDDEQARLDDAIQALVLEHFALDSDPSATHAIEPV